MHHLLRCWELFFEFFPQIKTCLKPLGKGYKINEKYSPSLGDSTNSRNTILKFFIEMKYNGAKKLGLELTRINPMRMFP